MLHFLDALSGGRIDRGLVVGVIGLRQLAASSSPALCAVAREQLHGLTSDGDSLRGLARVVGMPRETFRRHVVRLEGEGWIKRVAGEEWVCDARTLERVTQANWMERVDDLLWTAARVQEAFGLRPPPRDLEFSEVLAAVRATRCDQLPWGGSRVRGAALPDADAKVLACRVGGHLLRHVRRLLETFEGDVEYPLILGEIALTAYRRWSGEGLVDFAGLGRLQAEWMRSPLLYRGNRGCNAHSIALGLARPEQTIRRKLARMEALGWLARDSERRYLVTPALAEHTREMNRQSFEDLVQTAAAIPDPIQSAVPRP